MTNNNHFSFPDKINYLNGLTDWHEILSSTLTSADELAVYFDINKNEIESVTKLFPMRINRYYLSLIKKVNDPIWKQAVPDKMEIENNTGTEDPLLEEAQSPVPNLIHRYPDRVLFMVSDRCAMNCRFCMRKRMFRIRSAAVTENTINAGLEYIRSHKAIREVLISGGDPLLLEDDAINRIMEKLRSISHLEIIRIHTRVPCTLPQRITKDLADIIKRFHPVFINIHFNHYDEITTQAAKACAMLADAGIPLGCQTVLLKGVNDNPAAMKKLMQGLLQIRVKPYYIHHADYVKGAGHFRTSIKNGLKIMSAIYGHTSGLCAPHYMIDLPGGGGKVPLIPEYVDKIINGNLVVRNHKGKVYLYPLNEELIK